MRVPCGNINKEYLKKTILLHGWIKKIRKLGNLLFVDLYDKSGIVQILVDEKDKLFDNFKNLSKESVVSIEGIVNKRKNPNPELKTGEFEIKPLKLDILSKADNLPFVLEDGDQVAEEIRLKYRYLDLRRSNVKEKIILRSKIIHYIRNFLTNLDFLEIETPILCKPTPEGAKDYLVPTRNKIKHFFALPQSPQTFKQLLMIAGFEKYFQIARCFRDEPLRADRQPEFTQLDIEASFVDEKEIQSLIENILKNVFKDILGLKIKIPFERMAYNFAINNYGSDKPDLRYELKLQEANHYFKKTNFKIFQNILNENKLIKYLCLPKILINKNQITKLEKYAKDNNAKGIAWITIRNGKILEGSIAKIIEPEIIDKIIKDNGQKDCSLLFIADEINIVNKALGAIRIEVAKMFDLIKENEYKFLWITDWPLFEYSSEENRFVAAHHPFTAPIVEDVDSFDKNMLEAKARSYDIVLNGFEIGGGSIRINDLTLQERMFKALKLEPEEIKKKFEFLLEAFKYGVPPHGGIALGIDRLMMIITNSLSIKDIIAFPKNSAGNDLMLESPSIPDENDLNDLNLSFAKK